MTLRNAKKLLIDKIGLVCAILIRLICPVFTPMVRLFLIYSSQYLGKPHPVSRHLQSNILPCIKFKNIYSTVKTLRNPLYGKIKN